MASDVIIRFNIQYPYGELQGILKLKTGITLALVGAAPWVPPRLKPSLLLKLIDGMAKHLQLDLDTSPFVPNEFKGLLVPKSGNVRFALRQEVFAPDPITLEFFYDREKGILRATMQPAYDTYPDNVQGMLSAIVLQCMRALMTNYAQRDSFN